MKDGQLFACRGRDYELASVMSALQNDHADALENAAGPKLTDWEYGVGIKANRAVFLLLGSKVEKQEIGNLDLLSFVIAGQ